MTTASETAATARAETASRMPKPTPTGTRTCDLMRGTSGITKKTLRRQLAELETHGLVHRRLRPGGRRRAEYSLTPFGETLKPIVVEIYEWGLMLLENHDGRPAPGVSPGA